MRALAGTLILLSLSFAQEKTPASNRVDWNPSGSGATRKLPDGRIQRTTATKTAVVSVIADVVPARRFLDPPMDGGPDVAYIVIGIRNISGQTLNLDPATVTLHVIGKNRKELKRLTEENVVFRAWQGNDRNPSALPAMVGSMSSSGGGGSVSPDQDATIQVAIAQREQDRSNRIAQEKSEQQSTAQAHALSDTSLLRGELSPGKRIMGMVFFYPYEKNDKLELTIPVGDTTFVFPFSGREKKK